MEKSVWLSYDLGVKGDYDALYAYLDDRKAIECGDSFAFFRVEFSGSDQEFEQKIKSDIQSTVRLSKTDRIYIIYRKNDKGVVGKFITGRRKASPWQGYGQQKEAEDDGS